MHHNLFRLCLAGILLLSLHGEGGVDAVPHLPLMNKLQKGQVTSAYPNPFKDNTTIFYAAPDDAFIRVKLFNNQGLLMGEIYDDVVEKGATYQFELDGSSMVPGIYFYTIESDKNILHRRIELVR